MYIHRDTYIYMYIDIGIYIDIYIYIYTHVSTRYLYNCLSCYLSCLFLFNTSKNIQKYELPSGLDEHPPNCQGSLALCRMARPSGGGKGPLSVAPGFFKETMFLLWGTILQLVFFHPWSIDQFFWDPKMLILEGIAGAGQFHGHWVWQFRQP